MGTRPLPALVGREQELERLAGFVASLSEGASAVVVCGGAGIGKTAVWAASAARAEADGVRVLRSRCAEVEMPIAFGALADLLTLRFDEAAADLSALQRRALSVAFGRGDEGERPDWLVLAGAVLAGLQTLAARAPLLVAIDDLQWLDPGSRRVLAWALRRCAAAPVGLLATVRADSRERDPFALADTLPPDRFSVLDLGPLSVGALQHLLVARMAVHLPRPTLARVHRASGGNPLFALEFARSAEVEGSDLRATPLQVPASLEQLMRNRTSRLPKRLRPLLEVVAALERPTLRSLHRALADGDVEALVEDAARAELLVLDEDGTVRFAHPLLASTMYFAIPPRRRRALHQRLAESVEGLEERGRHAALAAAAPNTETAALVTEAATAAAARGALDAAAELAEEAARLTPTGEREQRSRRTLLTARWLVESGEFAAARKRLDSLIASEQDAGVRTEALLLRAECEFGDRRTLVALLQEAEAVAEEPRQRWQSLIRLAHHAGWVAGDVPAAVATARDALEVAVGLKEAPLIEASGAALDYYEAARGEAVADRRALRRGQPGQPLRMHWWQVSPALSLGCRLMWSGEFARAREVFELERASLAHAGRDANAGFVLCSLSELEWRAGDWAQAQTLAHDAAELLGDINPTAFPRALVAAGMGRAEEATTIAKGALAWATANEERVAPPRFHWLLGLLHLSHGDYDHAYVALAEAQTLLEAAGIRQPGYLPVLPDLADSLVALDRLEEAERAVARLEVLATARNGRWAQPAAQRSRAALLLARRDTETAAALAASAADGFATIGAPLDRGRALLVSGNAYRRLGERRRAAGPLTEAIEIFARLGAPFWLEQAEHDRRRASPRPRRETSGLTPAEARVAALVAAGRKNKEVAAELYTTVATVEAHLTRIYRKLALRSRSELVRRAANGTIHLEADQQ